MKTTIVKIDKETVTVEYQPDWLERFFGIKPRMEQYYSDKQRYRITKEKAWINATTGEVLGFDTTLLIMINNAYRIFKRKQKSVL